MSLDPPPGLKTVLFSFVCLVFVLSSHYIHTYIPGSSFFQDINGSQFVVKKLGALDVAEEAKRKARCLTPTNGRIW